MVQVKQMLVPADRANKVRYKDKNPKRKIVVHQTGNKRKGANAEMHARLQYNGNSREASWHYQVDDSIAYQSFSHDDGLWHAGNRNINKESIGVEICVNTDGDYDEAVKNGVELVKHVMAVENIDIVEVINHHDASGKWCPSEILNGREDLTWAWFKNQLGSATGKVEQVGSVKPSSSKPAYSGSIVDYLNQQGIASNINNRKNLAVEYGIVNKESDYTGTATQNTALLNAMMTGEPKQQGTRKEPIQSDYKGNSLVDYLVGAKKPNSFNDRKKLAEANGISNYAGTASQNLALLNKLRGGSKPTSTPKPSSAWTGQVLRQGNRGDAVRQLQEMLAKKYFYPDKGAKNNGIDGIFGTNTKNAVERFQMISGLSVDGIAGKATYNKLK